MGWYSGLLGPEQRVIAPSEVPVTVIRSFANSPDISTRVRAAKAIGRFREPGADKLKLMAETKKVVLQNAPIDLREIVIYYAGGDSQKVDINSTIKPEGYSRVIDLDGRERNLKKIAFVYKTVSNNNDKKARLQVWGLKADTDKK